MPARPGPRSDRRVTPSREGARERLRRLGGGLRSELPPPGIFISAHPPILRLAPPGCAPRREGVRERLRRLGGGLCSWLAVRCTRPAARYLLRPPSCGLLRPGVRQFMRPRGPVPPGSESFAAAPISGDPQRCGGGRRGGGDIPGSIPGGGRGVSPQQGAKSGERNGSERAKIASVAEGTSPASQGPRLQASPSRRRGAT